MPKLMPARDAATPLSDPPSSGTTPRRRLAALAAACWLAACGGGGGGGGGEEAPPPPASVTISGAAEYESVPNNPAANGALDYAAASYRPIRQATVQLLNSAGTVLASTTTSESGAYSFTLANPNDMLRVRVRAESQRSGASGGAWDVRVLDNTSGDALYVLDSAAFTPAASETRNLRAASGWGGSSYSSLRAAAPFAVLDVAVRATQTVLGVSPNQSFPALTMYWSANNRPAGGLTDAQLAQGLIGTSFYLFDSSKGHRLYLLGAANDDTDEYDSHVVAHEWGHYLQQALSRDDSTGGDHGPDDRLDMRVAFSEGWGNAWSGIALGDARYADSQDRAQSSGFVFDVSQAPASNRGWFSESSVQYLLWQFAQSPSIGYAPMFTVMNGPLRTSSIAVSIHQFSALLKAERPAAAGAIDALLAGQLITVNDGLGSGETNDGGVARALPIYSNYGGGVQQVCIDDAAGRPNKLGNAAYLRFAASGSRTLSLVAGAGVNGSDPDMLLIRADGTSQAFDSADVGSETATTPLPAGTHTVVLYDFNLIDGTTPAGPRCFNFSVQ
jgi:hypothetical protein